MTRATSLQSTSDRTVARLSRCAISRRDQRSLVASDHLYALVVSTVESLRELHTTGLVCLTGGFASRDAGRMRSLVWRELAAIDAQEDKPSTWPDDRRGKSTTRGLQGHRAFQAFWSRDVLSALDALFGARSWTRPTNAGDILLTFPEKSSSVRQLDPFHSDFAMDVPAEPLWAVKIFAFIGAVGPESGGTLVIRNSHRVVQRYLKALPPGFPRNRAASQFGADNPWVVRPDTSDLIGATHDCDGIDVQVEELTGAPGDVVITHPWTVHAGASNVGSTPRIMLGHRVFRTPA